jgi:hypothetical protein
MLNNIIINQKDLLFKVILYILLLKEMIKFNRFVLKRLEKCKTLTDLIHEVKNLIVNFYFS